MWPQGLGLCGITGQLVARANILCDHTTSYTTSIQKWLGEYEVCFKWNSWLLPIKIYVKIYRQQKETLEHKYSNYHL